MMTTHRVWKYGDNINTDLIFPGKYTYTISHDPAELARHALEDLDPLFAQGVQPGDVIVAGRNWGNGSSREQAVTCLVAAGVKAVIAASFARIYYRNAINNGLLVIQCPQVAPLVETGDTLSLDMEQARISAAGQTFSFPRLPESVAGIVQAGGLIPYLKASYSRE
ncbi:MAG TPA: 3-isopropylmalate dehydratase small subunit [Spirillospora sp.]|nr:3-isopropylmalate dehydratase small subunit [Spirillospora sp.]